MMQTMKKKLNPIFFYFYFGKVEGDKDKHVLPSFHHLTCWERKVYYLTRLSALHSLPKLYHQSHSTAICLEVSYQSVGTQGNINILMRTTSHCSRLTPERVRMRNLLQHQLSTLSVDRKDSAMILQFKNG